jgi:hypothetical protein
MDPQVPNVIAESPEIFPVPQTPQSPPSPKKPKDNHWISILAMAIFVVLTLGVVAFLYYQNQALKNMLASYQTPLPSSAPVATSDPTADWKVFSDDILKFSFKYPAQLTLNKIFRDDGTGEEFKLSSGENITVFTKYSSNQVNSFMNTTPTGEVKIGQTLWKTFYVPKGVPEPQVGAGNPIFALQTELNKHLIVVTLINQSKITEEQNQILSTFKFTETNTTPKPTGSINYIAPSSWERITTQDGLTLCLPPKWESKQYGTLIYNRDAGYQPTITIIQNIPYTSGSYADAYYNFWKNEYPNVAQLVTATQTIINGNVSFTFTPIGEAKSSPEGLTVVWYASGKLWKAGLSAWSMVNSSQAAFLKDFYTMVGCSF